MTNLQVTCVKRVSTIT